MTIEKPISARIIITIIVLALTGCANNREFETVPQAGANRTGVFPSFTQKPKAETAQFTQTERDELAKRLIDNRNRLEKTATPPAKDIERQKQEAAQAAKDTLHKIENTGQ